MADNTIHNHHVQDTLHEHPIHSMDHIQDNVQDTQRRPYNDERSLNDFIEYNHRYMNRPRSKRCTIERIYKYADAAEYNAGVRTLIDSIIKVDDIL